MANFKINLLTSIPNSNNGSLEFLETPISEFNNQIDTYKAQGFSNQKQSYCYTYNEKFSLHQNGQKELTFSMIQKMWENDQEIINPFINQLSVGSQILLIDKYDNEYFFTIKTIKYTFKQDNIIYDYSCQDSFTYQLIRQNKGYSINNNIESKDFIGAKSIDWWVFNKIQPECYIGYEYIPLQHGVYINSQGNLAQLGSHEKLNSAQRVIKPSFTIESFPEYHETFPFEVSNSSASSALISLAEEVGLMLNFAERNLRKNGQRTSSFKRYFWFEPKKNEMVTDLRYSPNTNIQNFGFNYGGSSLTTILNVEPTNVNDELITLLPNVPLFFVQLFTSKEWKNTAYSNGYFTEVCQGTTHICENSIPNQDFQYFSWDPANAISSEGNNYVYLRLRNKQTHLPIYNKNGEQVQINGEKLTRFGYEFTFPTFYKNLTFNYLENSYLYINNEYYTPQNSKWDILVLEPTVNWPESEPSSAEGWRDLWSEDNLNFNVLYEFNDSYSPITEEVLGESYEYVVIRIKYNSEEAKKEINNGKVILRFERDVDEEELEFARIADKCPWLDNKLIDFSYFLKNKIISQKEYSIMMDSLVNQLRIVNGQLLFYSREYYNAIRRKTEVLAELTSSLDSLGAAFNSDVVETYRVKGTVSNVDFFNEAYDTLLQKYYNSSDKTSIINYEDLLTEYSNKYFKAQQRFLKNMYAFKNYFNSPTSWGDKNTVVYSHHWTINTPVLELPSNPIEGQEYIHRYISFANYPSFSRIQSSFNQYDLDTLQPLVKIYTGSHTEMPVVYSKNYKDYYIYEPGESTVMPCKENDGWNAKQTYYRIAYRTPRAGLTSYPNHIDHEGSYGYTYWKSDADYYYYVPDKTVRTLMEKDLWGKNANETNDHLELTTSITVTITQKINQENQEVTITLSPIPMPLTIREIINEYLVYKAEKNSNTSQYEYYYRDTETTQSIDWWVDNSTLLDNGNYSDDSIQYHLRFFNPSVLGDSFKDSDWDDSLWENLKSFISNETSSTSDYKLEHDEADFYKAHFPIKSIIYKGPNFVESEYNFNSNYIDWDKDQYVRPIMFQPANKDGYSMEDYIEFLATGKQKYNKDVASPFDKNQWITKTIPLVNIENESKYYRRVARHGLSIAGQVTSAAFSLIPIYGWFAAAVTRWTTELLWDVANKWHTHGMNKHDFFNTEFNSKGKQGYQDTTNIIYTPKVDSYINYMASTSQFMQCDGNGMWNDKNKKILSQYNITNLCLNKNKDLKNWTLISDTPYNGKYWHIQTDNKINYYFNYWSNIGLTYSSLIDAKKDLGNRAELKYQDSYFRLVTKGEYINPKDKYYMLVQGLDKDSKLIFRNEPQTILSPGESISSVKYYFLRNCMTRIDFSDKTDCTIETALGSGVSYNKEDGMFTKTIMGKTKKFYIFVEENHRKTSFVTKNDFINNDYFNPSKRFNVYNNQKIYNRISHQEINIQSFPDLVKGLYVAKNNSVLFVTPLEWSDEKEYYTKDNNTYNRVYNIQQIKDNRNIYAYILNEDKYSLENYETSNLNTTTSAYLHKETYKFNGTQWVLSSNLDETNVKQATISLPYSGKIEKPQDLDLIAKEYKEIFQSKVTHECIKQIDLSKLTNGEFWYLYRNKTQSPLLFEEAAAIEVQLTTYWNQAYTASLYCEYFLPQYWQPRANGEYNNFTKNIIQIEEIDESTPRIKLFNTYIPEVAMVKINGSSRIPTYTFSYGKNYDTSDTQDEVSMVINDSSRIDISDVLENKAFQQAFSVLGEKLDNFTFNSPTSSNTLSKTNYYYCTNEYSGTKWSDLLSDHSNITTNYSEYNGLYVMIYKILKERFTNQWLNKYNDLVQKRDNIWKNLYQNYSHVLLEDTYSNAAAITSQDLFTMANYAFKDKQKPEEGYSITLIDINSLTGYKDQELRVGDSILLDVEEFYQERTDLFTSLSQYLFISDISYNLRSDTDISLTVNNIKYQDKLIQRIAKLIK